MRVQGVRFRVCIGCKRNRWATRSHFKRLLAGDYSRKIVADGPTARQVHESRHGIPCKHGDDPLACGQCSTTKDGEQA